MLGNKDLENLCKISTNVNAKENKIWELQQYHVCMTREIDKILMQIDHMKARTLQLEDEDDQLQILSSQLEKSIELQQSAIPVDNQMLTYLNLYKRLLNELNVKFGDSCSSTIAKYENDLSECRQNYEKQSSYYKQLYNEQIRLKQLQIKKMWLIVQIKNLQKQQQLFETIQKKKFQSNIIKFAQYYISYRNYDESFSELQKMKEVEQTLLKQHLNLQESVKELSRKKTMKPKTIDTNKRKLNDHTYANSERFQDNYHEFSQKLHAFLNNNFAPNQPENTPKTPQLKTFSNNHQKVKILDVQIITAPKNKIQNKTTNIPTPIESNNNIKSDLNKTILNLNPPQKNGQIKPIEKQPTKSPDNQLKINKFSQDNQKKTDETVEKKRKEPSLIQFEEQLVKFNEKAKQSAVKTTNEGVENLQIQTNKVELNENRFFITPKRVSFKIDNPQKSTTQTDTDDSSHAKSPMTENGSISDVELDETIFSFSRPNDSQSFTKEKPIPKEKSNDNVFKYPVDDSDHRTSEDVEQGTTSIEEDPFMFNMSFGPQHENAASTSTNLPFSFGQPQKNIFQLF